MNGYKYKSNQIQFKQLLWQSQDYNISTFSRTRVLFRT